jgi:hypothetical protein
MKRALAVLLVVAAFLPAASLLAAAFDCHSMPCCKKTAPVTITTGCCDPAVTRATPASSVAKSIAPSGAPAFSPAIAGRIAGAPLERPRFIQRELSPPREVRLRLATLATLLI